MRTLIVLKTLWHKATTSKATRTREEKLRKLTGIPWS
jgi:hypothetical protein